MSKYNYEPQGRGRLTERIKEISLKLLGYEVTVIEFRLMPYIISTMTNQQKIEPSRINSEEKAILKKWRQAGHIKGGASGLVITKEFWDICCELVFAGYVDLDE